MSFHSNVTHAAESSISEDCISRVYYVPETVLGVFSLTPHNNREKGTIIPLTKQIKLLPVIQLVSGKTNPRAPVFSQGAVGAVPQPPYPSPARAVGPSHAPVAPTPRWRSLASPADASE